MEPDKMLELHIFQNDEFCFLKPLQEIQSIGGNPSCSICLPGLPPEIKIQLEFVKEKLRVQEVNGLSVLNETGLYIGKEIKINDALHVGPYSCWLILNESAEEEVSLTVTSIGRYGPQDQDQDEMPLLTLSTPQKKTFCQPLITLGRNSSCDFVFANTEENRKNISRYHAEIFFAQGAYYIRDLQSKNGTYYQNARLQEWKLPQQGKFKLGDIPVSFSIEKKEVQEEQGIIIPSLNPQLPPKHIIGKSSAIRSLIEAMQRALATDKLVLIEGETGTGKELVARYLHFYNQKRNTKPFIVINCAAIPQHLAESQLFGHVKGSFTGAISNHIGVFREADKGTLFLDELGELPLEIQAKLLRALEEKMIRPVGSTKDIPIDVRVIAATNQNMVNMCQEKKFREDLYQRFTWKITVPPLRERTEDIPQLLDYFLSTSDSSITYHPTLIHYLCSHSWPGNVREFSSALDRAILNAHFRESKEIEKDDFEFLPAFKHETSNSTEQLERGAILSSLERNQWKVSQAIEETNIPRTTFYRRLKELDIDPQREKLKLRLKV